MTCFPLAITTERIGSSAVQDFNAQVPVIYINPANGQHVQVTVECDSVPPWSPVTIRRDDGFVEILEMADLWELPGIVSRTAKGEEVKILERPLRVPTSKGKWTRIVHLIRHPYVGKILRFQALGGIVDVTPNHSIYVKKPGKKYGKNFGGWNLHDARFVERGDLLDIVKIDHLHARRGLREGFFAGTIELAWLYGFFAAEGSAYVYSQNQKHQPGHKESICSVSFSNTQYQLLEKAAKIFEANFHSKMRVSGPYRGVFKIYTRDPLIYEWFRTRFYTHTLKKKVPMEILNAPTEIKRAFLEGYNDGDGAHQNEYRGVTGVLYQSFTTNSQTLAASLLWLAKDVVGQSYGIQIRDDKPDIIQVSFGIPKEAYTDTRPHVLQDRRLIKKTREFDYEGTVYDIETESHRFPCGVGHIMVHNTGAFISLAPASLATILGLNLTSGPTITLTGVGGSQIPAYVHQVDLQLGNDLYHGLTVAIASAENVPFLLGRVNFWDMASITIDNMQRTVCFTQIATGPTVNPAPIYGSSTDLVLAVGLYAIAGIAIYKLGGY